MEKLTKALKNHNIHMVAKTLKHHPFLATYNDHGYTFLMAAIASRFTEAMELLIKYKSPIDNDTLLLACSNEFVEGVELLLQYGAKPNYYEDIQKSPMCIAVNTGNLSIVKLLLEYDVDVNEGEQSSPLHIAISNKKESNLEMVKLLLENGADVDYKDVNDHTPLMRAVYYDYIDIAKILVEYGADTGYINKDNNDALIYAHKNNNAEMIKVLKSC
jgi:ankyrin repeat protein